MHALWVLYQRQHVQIALASVFLDGQAYVALSRVTKPSGLRVATWKDTCVRASPKVLTFYAELRELLASSKKRPR